MKKYLLSIIFSILLLNMLSAQVYVEQFDLSATPIAFAGSNAANISAVRIGDYGSCGEVKITNIADFSNGYQTFNYDFASPVTITSAADAVIKLRVRSASALPFRLAFRGDIGTGVKNLSCVWAAQQKSFTGDINTWQELSFDYSTAGDLNVSGCGGTAMTFPATIDGIAININSGSVNFATAVYIDYISIGATSPATGNATCKTDDGSGSPALPYFVEQFDPTQADPKAVTGTDITNTDITAARATESTGADCGQLDVQNAAGNLTTHYSTINYDTSLTVASSDEAVIRVRAKVTNGTAVPVRALFRGDAGSGTVNLSNVWAREEKSLPGDGQWYELVFYYGFAGDLNSSGGAGTALTFPAAIEGIGLGFYTGATGVSSTISIDYIALGNTGATCPTVAGINKSNVAAVTEIYPVPAEDVIYITTHGTLNEAQVKLMTGLGVTVKEDTLTNGEVSIRTSSLESGFYLLGIYSQGELVKIEKVIIK